MSTPSFQTAEGFPLSPAQAFSNPAYFSTSFFWPKPGKLTRSLAASPVPSRRRTRPRPYFGWRTCVPGAKSPPVEDDVDEGGAVRPPPVGVDVRPCGVEGRVGGVQGRCC